MSNRPYSWPCPCPLGCPLSHPYRVGWDRTTKTSEECLVLGLGQATRKPLKFLCPPVGQAAGQGRLHTVPLRMMRDNSPGQTLPASSLRRLSPAAEGSSLRNQRLGPSWARAQFLPTVNAYKTYVNSHHGRRLRFIVPPCAARVGQESPSAAPPSACLRRLGHAQRWALLCLPSRSNPNV